MDENRPSWVLVVGGGVVVGLLLVACVGVFLWLAGPLGGITGRSRFESNGAQIYFTGTSRRGTAVTAQMGAGMGRMRGSRLTCASCHGPEGRGGQVQMMMRIIEVSDIRYEVLTSEAHGEEEAHESYTEETIKRAITEGFDPDDEPMEWPMPRWSMSDEDLDDLFEFLKTLD
jgi:mono/diheme cytochrome c family protein